MYGWETYNCLKFLNDSIPVMLWMQIKTLNAIKDLKVLHWNYTI